MKGPFWLMETTCQASYPLNSENASPPGTLTVYLSCCARAKLPKTASNTATITIAGNAVLFMAHSYAAVHNSNFKGPAQTAGEPRAHHLTPNCHNPECADGSAPEQCTKEKPRARRGKSQE